MIFLAAIFILEELFKVIEAEYLSKLWFAGYSTMTLKAAGQKFPDIGKDNKRISFLHGMLDLVYFGFLIYCMGWATHPLVIVSASVMIILSAVFHRVYSSIFWKNLSEPERMLTKLEIAYRIDAALSLIVMNVLLTGLILNR
jgi:hypothetical protein